MKRIVKYPGFKPGVLVSRFTEKGIRYVRVEWTNIPAGEHYWHKHVNREGVFPEADCKIIRVKGKWEKNLIKFFKNPMYYVKRIRITRTKDKSGRS